MAQTANKLNAALCIFLVAVSAVPAFVFSAGMLFPAVNVILATRIWRNVIEAAEEKAIQLETGLSTAEWEWLEAQTKACDQAINNARYGKAA